VDTNLDFANTQKDSNASAVLLPDSDVLDDALDGWGSPLENKAVHRLFEAAIANDLRWPKIRLLAKDGSVVILRRAGRQSKFCGQILATSDGRYPYSVFYGRFDESGVLWLGRRATGAVTKLLRNFWENPLKVAFEYGMLTGQCCFCGLPLSDERSTGHGYGPVCARNYDLPWNAKRWLRGWQHNITEKGLQ
jgi:hypothetical protein